MFDQYSNQKVAQERNTIRNKLQISVRSLHSTIHKAMQSKCLDTIHNAIGQVQLYIEIRHSLAPTIGLDGYTNELKGKLHRLRALAEEFTPSKDSK